MHIHIPDDRNFVRAFTWLLSCLWRLLLLLFRFFARLNWSCLQAQKKMPAQWNRINYGDQRQCHYKQQQLLASFVCLSATAHNGNVHIKWFPWESCDALYFMCTFLCFAQRFYWWLDSFIARTWFAAAWLMACIFYSSIIFRLFSLFAHNVRGYFYPTQNAKRSKVPSGCCCFPSYVQVSS